MGPSSSESGGISGPLHLEPKGAGTRSKRFPKGIAGVVPGGVPLFPRPLAALPVRLALSCSGPSCYRCGKGKSGWPLGGALAPQMAGRGRLGLLGGVGCAGELNAVPAAPALCWPRQPPVPCLDPGLCLTLDSTFHGPAPPGASDL